MKQEYKKPTIEINIDKVEENYNAIKEALPNTDIYYAVKANPHKSIIDKLGEIGCFFDIASYQEYKLCQKYKDKLFYTHPIKAPDEIKKMIKNGFQDFVIDNSFEITKIPQYSNVYIRVKTLDYDCGYNLSKKFGCEKHEIIYLIEQCVSNNIYIKGLCFHVGSQISTNIAFTDMINSLKDVYDNVLRIKNNGNTQEQQYLSKFNYLDIGGGFPYVIDNPINIKDFCAPINEELEWFISRGIKTLAEPGRFIVANAANLYFSIIGKNVRNGITWYYADDGVYGSFLDIALSNAHVSIYSIDPDKINYESVVLAGPTCDSVDIISENIFLPKDLQIGDVLVAESVGAYVVNLSTNFNGLYKTLIKKGISNKK